MSDELRRAAETEWRTLYVALDDAARKMTLDQLRNMWDFTKGECRMPNAKKSPGKFPKTVYVTLEGEDTRDEYLSVHAELPSPDKTQECAVYELVKVARVTVTRKLEG